MMRSRASRAVLSVSLAVTVLTGGCATIKEKRTVIDGRQDRRVEVMRSADDPPRAQLKSGSNGDLVLALAEMHRCIERVLITTAQEARTEREAVGNGWFDGKTWYVAPVGLGVLGGVWTALGVVGASANPPASGVVGQDRAAANLTVGIGALLAAGAWTGIELYRLRTSVEPMGPKREVETKEVACDPTPVVRAEVRLTLNGATILTGTTDEHGEIPMKAEPLVAQVRQVARGLQARWPGQAQAVEVTEGALWALANKAPSGAGYSAYLTAFPEGDHRTEAETRERQAWAAEARDRAEKLLASQSLADAWDAVTTAENLGGDVGALKARISEARAKKAKKHLVVAWKLVKRDRPDEAEEERQKAEALGLRDEEIVAAIGNTPTIKKRAREEGRQRLKEEQRRQAQEEGADDPQAGPRERVVAAIERMGFAVEYLDPDLPGIGAAICAGSAARLKRALEFEGDPGRKADLKKRFSRALRCHQTNGSLAKEGYTTKELCGYVEHALYTFAGASPNSEAGRKHREGESSPRPS